MNTISLRKLMIAAVTLLMLISLQACVPKGSPDRLKSGAELYNYYCADCHQQSELGANLELRAKDKRPIKPYEIVLIIRHGPVPHHPPLSLRSQINDEKADKIAKYLYEQMQVRAEH